MCSTVVGPLSTRRLPPVFRFLFTLSLSVINISTIFCQDIQSIPILQKKKTPTHPHNGCPYEDCHYGAYGCQERRDASRGAARMFILSIPFLWNVLHWHTSPPGGIANFQPHTRKMHPLLLLTKSRPVSSPCPSTTSTCVAVTMAGRSAAVSALPLPASSAASAAAKLHSPQCKRTDDTCRGREMNTA